MNIGLILLMIIGGAVGVFSTLYILVSLPATIIFKIIRKVSNSFSREKRFHNGLGFINNFISQETHSHDGLFFQKMFSLGIFLSEGSKSCFLKQFKLLIHMQHMWSGKCDHTDLIGNFLCHTFF